MQKSTVAFCYLEWYVSMYGFTLISLSASCIVTVLTEKHSLVNFAAIAILPASFLYFAIAFKVGWSMFSDKESKF